MSCPFCAIHVGSGLSELPKYALFSDSLAFDTPKLPSVVDRDVFEGAYHILVDL